MSCSSMEPDPHMTDYHGAIGISAEPATNRRTYVSIASESLGHKILLEDDIKEPDHWRFQPIEDSVFGPLEEVLSQDHNECTSLDGSDAEVHSQQSQWTSSQQYLDHKTAPGSGRHLSIDRMLDDSMLTERPPSFFLRSATPPFGLSCSPPPQYTSFLHQLAEGEMPGDSILTRGSTLSFLRLRTPPLGLSYSPPTLDAGLLYESARGGPWGLSPSTTTTSPSEPSTTSRSTVSDVVRCENCDVLFSGEFRKGNLARHKRLKHSGKLEGMKNYKCPVIACNKVFARTDALLKHCRRLHPELAFSRMPRKTAKGSGKDPDVDMSNAPD
jgi:hypothetical protein